MSKHIVINRRKFFKKTSIVASSGLLLGLQMRAYASGSLYGVGTATEMLAKFVASALWSEDEGDVSASEMGTFESLLSQWIQQSPAGANISLANHFVNQMGLPDPWGATTLGIAANLEKIWDSLNEEDAVPSFDTIMGNGQAKLDEGWTPPQAQ